jgi:hypothetical protein
MECTASKRWTWTNWTQNDPDATYIVNPRVIETKIGDGTNVKRTTMEYVVDHSHDRGLETLNNYSLFGLVSGVTQYDFDQESILRRTATEYDTDSSLIDRRIIGLPVQTELFDENDALVSKTTYAYDEGNFSDNSFPQNITATQHDSTNYSSSYTAGRGNLTSTKRWDVQGTTG